MSWLREKYITLITQQDNMVKKKSYKKLYLTILRIGQDKVHEGVSYNQLKAELVKKGYDFDNDCIELSVKQWFYESFHHTGADNNPYSSVEDLNKHLDCSFILKGESCLKLLGYETSRNSWRNGIIAITLSLFAISIAIYINFFKAQNTANNDKTNNKNLTTVLTPAKNDTSKKENILPLNTVDTKKAKSSPN